MSLLLRGGRGREWKRIGKKWEGSERELPPLLQSYFDY